MKLSNLRENTKPVRLIIAGEVLNITVVPHRLTSELIDQYKDASDERDYDGMAAAFSEFVQDWDIVEDEGGDILPINGDTFRQLPLAVLNRIWDEVVNAVAPKSRKKSGN